MAAARLQDHPLWRMLNCPALKMESEPTMLEQTFCHIPGIGIKTEQGLWAAGISCWHEVAGHPGLPPRRAAVLMRHASESLDRLQALDVPFFAERLPANQHWRLFPHFRDRLAYLDIETTGLGAPGDHITTIALYDGTTIRHTDPVDVIGIEGATSIAVGSFHACAVVDGGVRCWGSNDTGELGDGSRATTLTTVVPGSP